MSATLERSSSSKPASPSGSGVPLALCSATFSVVRPSIAHLRRTGVSGMPISSSSSSLSSSAISVAVRPFDHLHQHRGRRLRDRAAAARELDLVDRLAVLAERDVDRDLVAAERVLALGLGVGILDRPVPARVLVVVEDDLAVQLVELAHANTFRTRVQAFDELVDLLGDGVEVEARAVRRGDAELLHQRLAAVVAGADRDALAGRGSGRRRADGCPSRLKETMPGAPLGGRAVERDARNLARAARARTRRARARAPRSRRARPPRGSRPRRRARPPRPSAPCPPRTCAAARPTSSGRADRADHVAAGEERLHPLQQLGSSPRARRSRSGRTSCGRRARGSRRRAPARRPSCAAPPAPRRRRRSRPARAPRRRAASTGLIVPSEFETRFVATTFTLPRRAISSSPSRSSSPCSSSGSIRKLGAGRLRDELPGDEVRVVLELGDDDDVARPEVLEPPRVRDEVDRLGRVADEDDLARARRVDEARASSRARPRAPRSRARRARRRRGGRSRTTSRRSASSPRASAAASASSRPSRGRRAACRGSPARRWGSRRAARARRASSRRSRPRLDGNEGAGRRTLPQLDLRFFFGRRLVALVVVLDADVLLAAPLARLLGRVGGALGGALVGSVSRCLGSMPSAFPRGP